MTQGSGQLRLNRKVDDVAAEHSGKILGPATASGDAPCTPRICFFPASHFRILLFNFYDLCRHHEPIRDSMATSCGTPPKKWENHQNRDGGYQYRSVNPIIYVGLPNQPVDCGR